MRYSISEIRLKYLFEARMSGAWGEEPEEGNSIVCIRAADFITEKLQHKKIDLTKRSFKKEEFEKKQLRKGDVILEKSGGGENQPVGRVVMFDLDEPALCSNFLELLRPNIRKVESKFVTYVLYSLWINRVNTRAIKQTTGIQNLDITEYLDTKVSLPSIDKQFEILKRLEKEIVHIDNLIGSKEKLLSILSEKKQTLITQAVTKGLNPKIKIRDSKIDWLGYLPQHWQIKRIKHVASKIGSGVTPKGGAEVYQQEGIPLVRSQNVHFDGLRLDDIVHIDFETHESMSNSKVEIGDVLLNITGASIGRCYYYEGQYEEANVNQHVCIIRPNDKILTKYLYYFLMSDFGQMQISMCQVGGGREGLTFESIKAFIIPLPEINEQQALLDSLETSIGHLNNLAKSTKRSIELLTERKLALITESVTGQLKID